MATAVGGFAEIRAHREKIDQVKAQLCKSVSGNNWDALVAAIGRPMGSHVGPPKRPLPAGTTSIPFEILRAEKVIRQAPSHSFDESDALFLAENRLLSASRGVLNSQMSDRAVNSLLAVSFLADYSFCMMADDEQENGTSTPPAILSAAWTIARSGGPWWPYDNAVVLTDRPAEIWVNERSLLHRGDGPAAVYQDGAPVYAGNGKPLPARWILQQQKLTPRELKEFDADFREYVTGRFGKAKPKAARAKKASAALKLAVPNDPAARLEQLRRHNRVIYRCSIATSLANTRKSGTSWSRWGLQSARSAHGRCACGRI